MKSSLRQIAVLLAVSASTLASSCTSHSIVTGFAGMPTTGGRPQEFLITTTYSLHFLFVVPLIGDGRMKYAVSGFADEARERGAEQVRIVDTSSETLWYALPPISFFLHPVLTSVEGELTMPEGYEPPPPVPKNKRASAKLRDEQGRVGGINGLSDRTIPDTASELIGTDNKSGLSGLGGSTSGGDDDKPR